MSAGELKPSATTDDTKIQSGHSKAVPPHTNESTEAIMARERLNPPVPVPRPPERDVHYPDRRPLPQNPSSLAVAGFRDGRGEAVGGARTVMPSGGPFAAQTLGTSFTGATLSGTNPTFSFPPDTMGAVGPTQFIIAVNDRLVSFNKSTGAADGVLNTTMDTFFSSVRNGSYTSDPRIRYDRLSGRWFIVIINVASPNRILLAWSNAASNGVITAGTVWSFTYFTNGAGSTCLADYPTLGIDKNALYIGTNSFCGVNWDYAGTDGYVLPKAALLAGTGTVTRFALVASPADFGPYTPQGVDNYDPSSTEGYFIGVDNATFGNLVFRRVSSPGSTPTISGNIFISVPATIWAESVPHLGNTGGANGNLDALDDRLFAAHIRNGRLWTAHNITVDPNGIATANGDGRVGVRWYELNGIRSTDNGGSPVIVQSGTLYDSTANVAGAKWFWIPSIMVSGQNHAALGFSTAGSAFRANAGTTGRWSSDQSATMQAFTEYTASSTAYNPGSDPGGFYGRRWGDYSYTSLDPIDDMTMWTIQEFCDSTNSYGVRAVKLIAPPPATPVSASPPSVFPGQTSVSVTITGTSTSGSGFFDPGANLAAPALAFSHIAALVSGGVVVNGITYNNPTSVTLDLDTTSATPGARDVRITNPDGQFAVGTGILTVNAATPTAPSITCPANFSLNTPAGAGSCGTPVTFSGATAATAWGYPAPAVTYSPVSGSTFAVGTTPVTATATNSSGTASCTFNVTVNDRTPPAITCPANIQQTAAYGATSANVSFSVTATDACGTPTVVSTRASGSTFPIGTTQVTSTATDGAGNTKSCSFNVTVAAPTRLFIVGPCRLMDTRNATGTYGGPVLASGAVRNVPAAGNCGIAAGAKSIAYNITAVSPANGGWMTLYPGGTTRPFVSSINYTAGWTRANNGVVPLGADGSLNIFNSGPDSVHFIIDVTGYFK